MQPIQDPKAMAKSLRQALAARQIEISHSDALECVARQLGWRDWNTLAAQIERPTLRLPEAWTIGGSRPEDYDVGVDEKERCALIRYRHASVDPTLGGLGSGFASLRQSVQARRYIGKRLRLSTQLRTQDVAGAGSIWMRVNGRAQTLAFDNMDGRREDGPLTGTMNWQDRAIVLDVPPESLSIWFGVTLTGVGGSVWARRFKLDEVDASTPVTDISMPDRTTPANLDFSAGS